MAPEIIELNGSTTASDIWSVGCTVIELLTGDPPYYDLGTLFFFSLFLLPPYLSLSFIEHYTSRSYASPLQDRAG